MSQLQVIETYPERGRLAASASITVNWLDDAHPLDIEAAIEKAARTAIKRVRRRLPQPAAGEQLPLPFPGA